MHSLSLKFSEAANMFQFLIWYCFLTSSSLIFLRLNLSTSTFCAACLLTANISLTFTDIRQWSVKQSAPVKHRTSSIVECHLLSINMWPNWLWVFHSGQPQVYKASPKRYRTFKTARQWAGAGRLRRWCCVAGTFKLYFDTSHITPLSISHELRGLEWTCV